VQNLEVYVQKRQSFLSAEGYGPYEETLDQFRDFDVESIASSVYNTRMNTPFEPESGNDIKYAKLRKLGDGSQCTVYEVVHMYTGDYLAARVFDKPILEKQFKQIVKHQLSLEMETNHVRSPPALITGHAHEVARKIFLFPGFFKNLLMDIHSQIVSHLPGVHRRVPNAACTPCYISVGIDCEPHLKHSYTDLIGSCSPLLLALVGQFELVGSALIVPTARCFKTNGFQGSSDPNGAIRAPYYCSVGWCRI
jgi:hypothetical protein